MAQETVETAVYRLRVEGQDQIDRLTKSIGDLTVAEEKATAQNRTTSDDLQKRLARYDPLIRAQQAYSKELQNIARYQETGVGTQQQINALFEGATARYQAATNATQQLGEAHKGLSSQGQAAFHSMRSMVESIAMGASPMQALIAQFNHLAYAASGEGGIVGAFKQVANMVGGPFMAGAIGGVAALAASVVLLANAWDKAAVAQQRAISGAATRGGTTASDINAFVAKNTPSAFSSSTLTTTESRALAEAVIKDGNIVISQLHNMSDAVLGFSNQSQKSVTEAIKVFEQLGKDPKKAMDQIEETMGAFSQKTRDIVDDAVKQGDATRAANAVIDEMNIKLKDAAGNMDAATQTGRGLRNVFGTLFSASAGTPLEKQLEDVRQKLSEVIEEAARMPPEFISPAAKQNIIDLSKQFEELYKRQQDVLNNRNTAVFDDITKKAREATEALIPEIQQIEALEIKIRQLKAAEDAGGGSPRISAAKAKAESDLQTLNESEAASKRIVEETNRIAAAHEGVSKAVALTLDGLEKQTALAGAVGAAEKQAAQYAIDYADAKKQGVTAVEATKIATEKQAGTEAAVNASAKETLWNLQNQLQVSGAITAEGRIAAQQRATYNKLIHDGVKEELAWAVARAEAANAGAALSAAATANVLRQVDALKDSTEMIKAQQYGTEATTAAAIAYKNAIKSGADSTSAAALSAATLANYAAKAAVETEKMAKSMDAVARSYVMSSGMLNAGLDVALQKTGGVSNQSNAFSAPVLGFNQVQLPGQQYTFDYDPVAGIRLGGSAIASGVGQMLGAIGQKTRMAAIYAQIAQDTAQKQEAAKNVAQNAATAAQQAQVTAMAPFELQLAQAQANRDVGGQVSALQGELGLVRGLPPSTENYQKIASLQDAIENLTKSTDSLNATNQDLLSPYYTQDPRTTHIGFRAQGMALGGYVEVPGGYSSNDNMLASIPVASGERIYVDPMTNRRGTSAGGSPMVINISSPITINGNANADQFGRTVYQNNQQLAKQVRAATQ